MSVAFPPVIQARDSVYRASSARPAILRGNVVARASRMPTPCPLPREGDFYFIPFTGGYTSLTPGCILVALSGLLSYMQMATALTLGCVLAAPVSCALRARAHLLGFCTLTRARSRTSTTTRTSRTREKREKRRATISMFWSSVFPTAAHSVLLQGVFATRKAR